MTTTARPRAPRGSAKELTPLEQADAIRTAEELDASKRNVQRLLAEYVGRRVTENSAVTFHDEPKNKYSLPVGTDLDKAIKDLSVEAEALRTKTRTIRQLNCRVEDGLVAMYRVIERVFGATGRGITHYSFFDGEQPPQRLNVTVGLKPDGTPITLSVPCSEFEFSWLEATIDVDTWASEEDPQLLQLIITHPMSKQVSVDGLLQMIEDEVQARSIYKGEILEYRGTDHGHYTLQYVHRRADPTIVYSQAVQDAIEDNVWGKIKYALMLDEAGQDTHFKVLFWGPLGTGKSEASVTTALLAKEHGRTVIEYKPTSTSSIKDLVQVFTVARRYGPAIIAIEDIDRFFAGQNGISANDLSTLTNLFDGVDKGNQISVIMTTNRLHALHPSMTRAERLTAQIEVGPLDQDGMVRLIMATMGDQLDPDTDMDAVWAEVNDFSPAFIRATFKKALSVSIIRNGRPGLRISTDDVVRAARSHRAQHELHSKMIKALEDPTAAPTINDIVGDVIRHHLERMQIEFPGSRLGTGSVKVATNGVAAHSH